MFGKPVFADGAIRPWPHPAHLLCTPEYRRLAVCVLAALALHLLIFGLMEPPRKSGPIPVPSLILQWVPLPSDRIAARPDVASKMGLPGNRPARSIRNNRGNLSVPSQFVADGTIMEKPRATGNTVYLPYRDSADLIESAGKIARNVARAPEERQQGNGALHERPFLPKLDRALRKGNAGEMRFTNGLIKITTESGRVYCLQSPPDFARGGPVDMLSVPTNCP